MPEAPKTRPEALRNAGEDSQLTIKIPNPKVYIARQSLWIGRRGKPRCDHCRLNNLKCDRVLPACNHCSWSSGRVCKYTPLPTPAHRGIPRCDRCRSQNLKCDRSSPVCNHCKEDKTTECNYTPKKRRKVTSQITADPVKRETVDNVGSPSLSLPDFDGEDGFYDQTMASTSRTREGSLSSPSGGLIARNLEMGRSPTDLSPSPFSPSLGNKPPDPKQLSYSYSTQEVISSSPILPWTHSTLAPLPYFIVRGLESINSAEMPSAATYNESLTGFLGETLDELRETWCLTLDTYATVSRCLSSGDTSELSPKLREWITLHHLCSGSDRFNLILMPRESTFQADERSRESYRRVYCAQVDANVNTGGRGDSGKTIDHFDRLPVREQIFDLLTYAHVSHNDAFAMLSSVKSWGFASVTWPMAELYLRLCPSCSLRSD